MSASVSKTAEKSDPVAIPFDLCVNRLHTFIEETVTRKIFNNEIVKSATSCSKQVLEKRTMKIDLHKVSFELEPSK